MKTICLIDQKNNVIHSRKCKNCNEFVFSNKTTHDFLKHYDIRFLENELIDFTVEKPLNITKIGHIEKFEITFKEHSSSYDFFDSVTLVEDFLNAVKNKIPRYSVRVLIRAGFSIENIQQPLDNYTEPLTQKRVIYNRLSGSAWNFHKFNYLNVKVLQVVDQLMR